MCVMFFNVKLVREFLLENGEVYTLRKQRKRIGRDTAITGDYYHQNKLAKINIELVGKIIHWSELIKYVMKSGLFPKTKNMVHLFLSKAFQEKSKEWFELAKKLSGEELYLYYVTVTEKFIRGET